MTLQIGYEATGVRLLLPDGLSIDDTDKLIQEYVDDVSNGDATDWWVEDVIEE